MSTKVSVKPLQNFKDAGTERQFEAGKVVEIDEGEFKNYAAAGLVEKADATAKADSKKA